MLCGRLKNLKSDFWIFFGQKADFSGKKRTNLEFFLRSTIRPRSDKADLLGIITASYVTVVTVVTEVTVETVR